MAMEMVRLVKELNRIVSSAAAPSSSLSWKMIRDDAGVSELFKERLVSVMMSCRQYKRIDFNSQILNNDPAFDDVEVTLLPEAGWINPLKSQQAQAKQQARTVGFDEAKKQRVEAEKEKMERLRKQKLSAAGGGTVRRSISKPGEPDVIEEVEEVEEIEYVDDDEDEVTGDMPPPPPMPAGDDWDAPPPPPLDDELPPPPPLPTDDWDAPPPPPPADDWDAPPPPPPADDWDAPPPPPPDS